MAAILSRIPVKNNPGVAKLGGRLQERIGGNYYMDMKAKKEAQ